MYVLALSLLIILSINIFPQSENDSVRSFSLSEIEITAKKIDVSVFDSDSKIELIDNEKLTLIPGSRAGDKLKYSNSVNISSYGISPSLTSASMNGFGFAHTLVLINGVRANSFQNSGFDLSLLPSSIIERIEIIDNGAASLYGSDAVGGVINIQTLNRSAENNFSIKTDFQFGSFNTKKYSSTLSSILGFSHFNLFYFYASSKGNYDYFFNNGIETIKKSRENSAYYGYDAGLEYSIVFNKNVSLNLFSTYVKQYKEIPGIETGSNPSISNQLDKNWNTILSTDYELTSSLLIKSTFNYQNNLTYYKIVPLTPSNYKNIVYSFSTEAKLNSSLGEFLFNYSHTNASLNSNELTNLSNRIINAIGTYSKIELNRFFIYPSIRYENISDLNKNILTASLGCNYKPFDNTNFSIKGNVGNNFRSPAFNDLYWKIGGNKNLSPEKSFNIEGGLIYGFNFMGEEIIEFSYKNIYAEDKIIWLPTPLRIWSPINIAASRSEIFSFTFSYHYKFSNKTNFNFDIGATATKSIKKSSDFLNDPSFNKQLIYIPFNTINSSLTFNFNYFGIGLFYKRIGKRYTDSENKKSLLPHNLFSGSVYYSIPLSSANLSFNLECNNILNEDYSFIAGYPMPLRNYNLTISFQL